jgi:hypothetical protein
MIVAPVVLAERFRTDQLIDQLVIRYIHQIMISLFAALT